MPSMTSKPLLPCNSLLKTFTHRSLRPSLQASHQSLVTRISIPKQTRTGTAVSTIHNFSTAPPKKFQNRIYDSVRSATNLQTHLLTSTSTRAPLLTLWITSYCPVCSKISPLLRSLLSHSHPPNASTGPLLYCEVEFDAPDIMDSGLGMTYMINSIPTLLVFDRGEVVERVSEVENLRDRKWVRRFLEEQGRRKGDGTGGDGGGGGGLFGLFGGRK